MWWSLEVRGGGDYPDNKSGPRNHDKCLYRRDLEIYILNLSMLRRDKDGVNAEIETGVIQPRSLKRQEQVSLTAPWVKIDPITSWFLPQCIDSDLWYMHRIWSHYVSREVSLWKQNNNSNNYKYLMWPIGVILNFSDYTLLSRKYISTYIQCLLCMYTLCMATSKF